MTSEDKIYDKFTAMNELARRRGFFWQSYEIYGGASGFATYGYLGARVKQNIERKLRELFVFKLGIMEIESPIITPEKVFEASGHIEHFKEPMVECSNCHKRFRADHLLRDTAGITESEAEKMTLAQLKQTIEKLNICCPECGGTFTEPKLFLTMFKTTIGPYSDTVGYGRPEAAQGIFVEFKRLYEMAREKLPFGAIQIGRALRNEISPRQGLVRLREFTIGDLEFFFDPEEPNCYLLKEVENEPLRLLLVKDRLKQSEEITETTVKEALHKKYIKSEWQAVFMAFQKKLLVEIGVPHEKQRFIEKQAWERAHYSSETFDQEVLVERWNWLEVNACACRTDYDLKRHMEASGQDMYVFKEYEKPIERECTTAKPIMAKMGPAFKKEAGTVAELLSKTSSEELETAFKKNGYFQLAKYRIIPEQVDIKREKIVERGRRFIPYVIEPTFGADRLFYVAFEYAYRVKDDRTVLSFPRDISPVHVGLYPLVSKDGLPEKAMELHRTLLNEGFVVEYDDSGSIGRRYARTDEAGIPLGITVDYDTLKDDTVTIRDRDTWKQVRSPISELPTRLHMYFRWKISFEQLGKAM